MKPVLVLLLLSISIGTHAQSYDQQLRAWQQHYKQEFLTDPRSPLKAADTGYLRFFPISNRYSQVATLKLTPDVAPVSFATHSGKTKSYRQYGELTLALPTDKGTRTFTLSIYESVTPIADTAYYDELFLPFFDLTNYETTYGGGRYIDLRKRDINDGKIIVDFNKAYNPYCAFGEGFSCPIPPTENKLDFPIEAGEKLYGKPQKD